MTIDDEKLAFFFRHWKQIAEWTALLRQAVEVLDRELLDALETMGDGHETPFPQIVRGTQRAVRLHIDSGRDAWIELNWGKAQLIELSWPALAVVWNKDLSTLQVRRSVKAATRDLCVQKGLTTHYPDGSWWVWSGQLRPAEGPFDLDDYVSSSVERFRTAWTTMHGPIQEAIASA